MKNCKEVRLIDANELEQKLLDEFNQSGEYTPYEYAIGEALNYLNEQPTIDPENFRPHGKWELNEDGKWSCSCCGGLAVEHPNEPEKWQALTTCCPNCGAIMEVDNV